MCVCVCVSSLCLQGVCEGLCLYARGSACCSAVSAAKNMCVCWRGGGLRDCVCVLEVLHAGILFVVEITTFEASTILICCVCVCVFAFDVVIAAVPVHCASMHDCAFEWDLGFVFLCACLCVCVLPVYLPPATALLSLCATSFPCLTCLCPSATDPGALSCERIVPEDCVEEGDVAGPDPEETAFEDGPTLPVFSPSVPAGLEMIVSAPSSPPEQLVKGEDDTTAEMIMTMEGAMKTATTVAEFGAEGSPLTRGPLRRLRSGTSRLLGIRSQAGSAEALDPMDVELVCACGTGLCPPFCVGAQLIAHVVVVAARDCP